ncbi:uncharacterized protein I206_102800 [Kwoniella pini CBS 10737]|uniref:Uncharacterized protein n=1 Tax=Kwoniella pini CBS 10737 TaxID=1296096 RepID=A0A1B9I6E9_9TREE|nr:uncharacterized protein I206_03154 [Kwoniella pini CBS 10737]OCF51088.1 hypothetical protein I206_03154 [Kwoniella pini CBS 10737]
MPNSSRLGGLGIERRGGTAPNGQVLADWQTYLSYVTTINDTPYTVTTIANLPLTYYGPSIPLGDGWTYGGLTSPTDIDQMIPPMTNSVQSPTTQIEITSPTFLTAFSSTTPSATPPVSSPMTSSSINIQSTTSITTSSSTRLSTRSSAVPPTSSSNHGNSDSVSTFFPHSVNDNPTTAPSPIPTNTNTDNFNLLAPLLGALIPLVLTILILLVIFCVYHKNRHSRDSRFFGLFSTQKRSSVQPDPTSNTRTGKSKETVNVAGTDEDGVKSPNEKSALLPGWTAQHHRLNSDSSSQEIITETNDGSTELAKRNETLLQRLDLGLGWLIPGNQSSLSKKDKESRVVSGNTLEKGHGSNRSFFSPSAMANAATAGLVGLSSKKDKRNTAQSSSAGTYERVLDDDQLFFSVPRPNRSSEESRTSQLDARSATGGLTIPHSPKGKALDSPAEIVNMASGSFSIGIPYTPNTEVNDISIDLSEIGADRRRARWSEDSERIRFPAPPGAGLGIYDGGTFGRQPRIREDERRESYMSGETEYYSAPSQSSSSHIPSTGIPIPRDAEEYRHVSVSAFGSHPSTPTRPARFSRPGSMSSTQQPSQRDLSPVKLISPLVSPRKAQSAHPNRPISGVGSTFHSIRNLFTFTPASSPDIRNDTSVSRDNRKSYVGQPIIDERFEGTNRKVSEFGEPLKQGALVASTVVSPRPSHSSERASLHLSIPTTQYHSHSSHTTSGSSNDATEASHEPALRGKRSKGTLIKASKITVIQDQSGPSNLGRRSIQVDDEDREWEWEDNIDEFLAEGEELPPLTPDGNGMRDKGLRDSLIGRWSGSSP